MKANDSLSLWRILGWCFLSVCLLPLLPVLFVVLPFARLTRRKVEYTPADTYVKGPYATYEPCLTSCQHFT